MFAFIGFSYLFLFFAFIVFLGIVLLSDLFCLPFGLLCRSFVAAGGSNGRNAGGTVLEDFYSR